MEKDVQVFVFVTFGRCMVYLFRVNLFFDDRPHKKYLWSEKKSFLFIFQKEKIYKIKQTLKHKKKDLQRTRKQTEKEKEEELMCVLLLAFQEQTSKKKKSQKNNSPIVK